MSQKYQGIFIFGEWLDALNQLPAETAMEIINNIYRYDVTDAEPPQMAGGAQLVQSIMLAHERRNKASAAYGRKGAASRWNRSTATAQPPAATPPPVQGAPLIATEYGPISAEDAAWDAERAEVYARVRAKREAALSSSPPQ